MGQRPNSFRSCLLRTYDGPLGFAPGGSESAEHYTGKTGELKRGKRRGVL